jgi:hypothetical protein
MSSSNNSNVMMLGNRIVIIVRLMLRDNRDKDVVKVREKDKVAVDVATTAMEAVVTVMAVGRDAVKAVDVVTVNN